MTIAGLHPPTRPSIQHPILRGASLVTATRTRCSCWLALVAVHLAVGAAGSTLAAPDALSMLLLKLDALHRITAKPHRMADSTATFCDITFNPNIHEGDGDPAYCHVYTNATARQPLLDGAADYPVGAVIVKSKLRDATATKPTLFTVMTKMKDGYDPAHGNWEYAVVDGGSLRILARGRIDSCIACHKEHKATDYITRTYLPRK